MANEAAPEQLLDVFRTAALSVTKLYKSSITAQAKARAEGYQDCLDDLLQYLDKENLGVGDGEGWKIRGWANERLDARDVSPQMMESDDDAEKSEPMVSSPEVHGSSSTLSTQQEMHQQRNQQRSTHAVTTTTTASHDSSVEVQAELEQDTPIVEEIAPNEPESFIVPSQENFDFRSSHCWPQQDPTQNQLNFGSLRLSDNGNINHNNSNSPPMPRSSRSARHHGANAGRRNVRMAGHTPNPLGRGAGTKRQLNYEELFELPSLGQSKDGFGGPGAKRRHI